MDLAAQYFPTATEPEKVITKAYIGRQRSNTDISPMRSDRELGRVASSPLPSRIVDSALEDCSDVTNVTKSHAGRTHLISRFGGDLLSSSDECLSASDNVRDSPRDVAKKDSPRGVMVTAQDYTCVVFNCCRIDESLGRVTLYQNYRFELTS